MEEKTKLEIEQEKREKRAIEKENNLLKILLPSVGLAAFIIGLLGFILTVGADKPGVPVFYAILFVLGLLGILYGILLIIRLKKPDFLTKKKPEEVEDEVLPD